MSLVATMLASARATGILARVGSPASKTRRVFAVMQFPILDARNIVNSGRSRLPRPCWPDPRPQIEFVRGVGSVESRPRGPVPGWDGELAFCSADGLLKISNELPRCPLNLTVRYRRLFGTEDGYRLDVAFILRCPPELEVSQIAKLVMDIRVRVPGVSTGALVHGGGPIAQRLAEVTSRGRAAVDVEDLVAGAPALLIEVSGAGEQWPRLKRLPISPKMAECITYLVSGAVDQQRALRPLRSALWRLHTELELLRELGRLVRTTPVERLRTRSVIEAIGRMCGPLARERRFGIWQPPLIALSCGPHKLRDILALADIVRDQSLGLARRLEVAVERAERHEMLALAARQGLSIDRIVVGKKIKEVVMGDKNRASGHGVVVSRSNVVNSFNQLQADSPELAAALKSVLGVVRELDNTEAVELAEELISSAQAEKRGVFRAAWERLKEIAPVVASLAGVAAAVARFLQIS